MHKKKGNTTGCEKDCLGGWKRRKKKGNVVLFSMWVCTLTRLNFGLLCRSVAWQEASLWLMWRSFPASPTSSVLGTCMIWMKNSLSKMNACISEQCNLMLRPKFSPHFDRLCGERYPNLAAYYNCLKERPSIKATWPPHWLENPQGQDLAKDIWDESTPKLSL